MRAHSFNQLNDRRLWHDGDSSFDPKDISSLIHQYDVKYVDYMDDNIRKMNRFCLPDDQIHVKSTCRPLSFDWNIPDEYKNLDVEMYVFDKLYEKNSATSESELADKENRVATEMMEYQRRGMYDILRTLIYVINILTHHNKVWGIGRGSSVSSYVLYLIGVHDVDSYAYELDITDFLHD